MEEDDSGLGLARPGPGGSEPVASGGWRNNKDAPNRARWGSDRGSKHQNKREIRNQFPDANSHDDQSEFNVNNDTRGNRNPKYGEGNRENRGGRGSGRISGKTDQNDRRDRSESVIYFKTLQDIANADTTECLQQIHDKLKYFRNLLESPISNDKQDMFVLVIKVVAKVSTSAFEELKRQLLLVVCNSAFLTNLRNYLLELPYVSFMDKRRNNLYWKNPNEFWQNLVNFCDHVVTLTPSIAMQKCRSLIEGTMKACLDALAERHEYKLPIEYDFKIKEMRDTLHAYEKKMEQALAQKSRGIASGGDVIANCDQFVEPPDDFRQLSVFPTHEDFLDVRPFLRPNIVQGSYRDAEHYLDVQFRLMREDCMGPLREGISQYIDNPRKRKYDNIRVYASVKFVEPYVSRSKIGTMVQFDGATNGRLKRINWAHSKRLIFGSLLIFSNDNFQNFIVATVLDRDEKELANGRVAVCILNKTGGVQDVYEAEPFVMIESEVYFEPYLHVLRALQDPGFPAHMAMAKYIVHVDPNPGHPSYLKEGLTYKIDSDNLEEDFELEVLNETTWPSSAELKLDESQYEAYKLALTHEFAVIQGPPGTGKTFLGVKVAKTILDNLQSCKLLLICYTNHALDQFLEAIHDNVTEKIVRIGGQSRCEKMQPFNINNLRRNGEMKNTRLYREHRYHLKRTIMELQRVQDFIDTAKNGILTFDTVKKYVPGVQSLVQNKYGFKNVDPIEHWLFEYLEHNEHVVIDHVDIKSKAKDDDIDDEFGFNRNEIIFDDIDENDGDDEMEYDVERVRAKTSFTLVGSITELKRLYGLKKQVKNRKDEEIINLDILYIKCQIRLFQDMAAFNKNNNQQFKIEQQRNPSRFSIKDRWSLYFSWAKVVIDKILTSIGPLQQKHEVANTAYEETRMMMDLDILNSARVVGMTTSGAARLRKLLRALKPEIVIVEEAAEVLESHIVTALTRGCQHLILIGDHQQLRPSAAHFRLARHYNMEISLFERMISNGVHSRRLAVQHRMRPQIAALISPAIYPELANHASVEAFPAVRGMVSSLFFVTHDFKEEPVEDSASRSNHKEADLVLALANYLIQQDYQPEDVTILAAYSGQMFYMRKERANYLYLSNVRIVVVDNYQGEESKIILLSLVRNNAERKIGFLGSINRVCVALSRAREGFYIFGNMDLLKEQAEIWETIAKTLEGAENLGSHIKLRCENHTDQITEVSVPEDFHQVPEGGCMQKCGYNLICGHLCPQMCHGYDRGHIKIQCPLPCERIICELNHVCPLMCKEDCRPCEKLIEKELPCGHTMKVYCHQDPTDPSVKCLTTVNVTLPDCGHQANKPCYQAINRVVCHVPCPNRVESCGHQCRLRCHVNFDPHHEQYTCEKSCTKSNKGCTADQEADKNEHQCKKRCHEPCDDCHVKVKKKRADCSHSELVACNVDVNATPCRKYCTRTLPCSHHCKKICSDECGDCKVMVEKIIPECGHSIQIQCRQEPKPEFCWEKCTRTLSCGHRCMADCCKPCNPELCKERVQTEVEAPCGHKVKLPCNVYQPYLLGAVTGEDTLKHCQAPCDITLECSHLCSGSCGSCRQGRLHVPCSQRCNRPNICGHDCKEPCNQVCPPCREPCEVKCEHSKCNKICGAPCTPCKEKCNRRCRHRYCNKLCGAQCSRGPCLKQCPLPLACGHACRGVCGEPCPDICNICRPDDFPRDFLGYEFSDEDMFVRLEDCGHVLELEDLVNLMTGDQKEISIRSCPFCRRAIINTPRYKDIINRKFKNEINPVKEKVYGTKKQIESRLKHLEFRVKETKIKGAECMKHVAEWRAAYIKLNNKKDKGCTSLLQIEMRFIYIDILDILAESFEKFVAEKLKKLKAEFVDQIILISAALAQNINKLSPQTQKDISIEIKRMDAIINLSRVISQPECALVENEPEIATQIAAAKKSVLTWEIFEESAATASREQIQKAVKMSSKVLIFERQMIVKAIGLQSGHWYKCPNGHFYCIADCGGAMVESQCIECKAKVGGTNHRLISTNRHAPEMDGSRHAAWSEQANMANYRL